MNSYYPGNLIKLQGTFKSSGTLTDPTTVRLLYKEPNGTVTVKSSTATQLTTGATDGVYYYNLAVTSTQTGNWLYWFESTGTVVASYMDAFRVMTQDVST